MTNYVGPELESLRDAILEAVNEHGADPQRVGEELAFRVEENLEGPNPEDTSDSVHEFIEPPPLRLIGHEHSTVGGRSALGWLYDGKVDLSGHTMTRAEDLKLLRAMIEQYFGPSCRKLYPLEPDSRTGDAVAVRAVFRFQKS